MFHSEGVVDTAGTAGLTLGLETRMRPIEPAIRRPDLRADSEDPLHSHLKNDLRRRLLEMILRNEQRRKQKPR